MSSENVSLIVSLIDRATAPARRIAQSFRYMSRDTRQSIRAAGESVRNLGLMVTGAAAAVGIGAARAAGDEQSALGELRSVMVKDMALMRKAARDFSGEWAGTTAPAFLAAAYDIKSGISSLNDEGVAGFTSLAAMTAKATKATVADMTSLFATGYGIYKDQYKDLSDLEFGEVFSAGIAAAVQAYKTTGPKMAAAISTLGASATQAKVPLAEQLHILGEMQKTMKSGEEAGTAYRAFIASVGQAGKKLGLPFLNANKQVRSTAEILDLLRQKYGETIDAVEKQHLVEAFGREEAVKVVDLLYGKTDDLRRGIGSLYQAMKKGTATTRAMAQEMNQGLNERWQITVQKMQNSAAALGETLKPVLMPFFDGLGRVLDRVRLWAEENPVLARTLFFVVGGLGVLATVLGIATVAMAGFNMVAAMNPITWIVVGIIAGIMAVVAVVAVMIAYWDEVVKLWDQWGNLVIALGGVVLGFVLGPIGVLIAVAAMVANNWKAVWSALAAGWEAVVDGFKAGVDAVAGLFTGLWDGITGGVSEVWTWVKEQLADLTGWLPDWAKEKLGLKVEAEATGKARPGVSRGTFPAAEAGRAAPGGRFAAAEALPSRGEHSRMDGKVEITLKNAPPGTRVERMEERGGSDVDLSVGLHEGMAF